MDPWSLWIYVMYVAMLFMGASLAPGQSQDYSGASEVILRDKGKSFGNKPQQNTTKHEPCAKFL